MDEHSAADEDFICLSLEEFTSDLSKADRYVFTEHKRVVIMVGDREVGSVAAYGGDSGRSGSIP